MNPVRDILTYIAANTSLVIGTDLFMGVIPTTKEIGISCKQIDGSESESLMQTNVFHFDCRYYDYDTAYDNAETIYNLLANSKGVNMTNITVFNSYPLKNPSFIGVTDQNTYSFTFSIIMHYERT